MKYFPFVHSLVRSKIWARLGTLSQMFSLLPQHERPDVSRRAQKEAIRKAWGQVGGLMQSAYRQEISRINGKKE